VHIVAEVLDVVAPCISSWVIVDTGSDDGTQDLIRNHMDSLGIPGELHECPWRNFGHNRTEALSLAQGHADYIWAMDADDTIVGTPDFTRLTADIYLMRYFGDNDVFWVALLFRDGVPVRWQGVTHEYAMWDDSSVVVRLEGDYNIEDRHLSTRNLSGEKYARDRDLLLAELERNPEDARSAFYLAQSYFCLGDLVNARKWYARRIELGGWAEEVGYSMYKLALSMEQLGEPWPDVQDAYLRAWEFRPARAEALHAIARRCRADQRYRLGYLFASRAADVPFPEQETLFVRPDIYAWRIGDEQAVCASWIDKHAEAFALCASSVLDVGCGVGGWVATWLDSGVDAIGVDGDYVPRDQLRVPADRFIDHDLAAPLDLGRRFDLVTCLEVAEHLPAEAAETLINSLCRHADVVVFSAAAPGQGGTGHVNERWLSFWAELFATHDYQPYDLLRSRLWWDERCEWWYRQNVIVFATGEVAHEQGWPEMTGPLDMVHPELFALRCR
jgi:SAM-dependent methyltransferase